MANQELIKIFSEMAISLRMKDIPFKPQAYERAVLGLESLGQDAEQIYQEKGIEGLKQIPGIGQHLAEKIKEFLETGEIKSYQKMKQTMPVKLQELLAVEGIGPKMIKSLWLNLKIKNLKDLEKAARAGKISKLPDFGEKTEKNILAGINFLKRDQGRFLLGDIYPRAQEIVSKLKQLKEVEEICLAGSLRRAKDTAKDVDILVVSRHPAKVTKTFVSLPIVLKIWSQGLTKASVRTKHGFDADLRIVPAQSYGAALQYFTGSKEHNIAMRKIAMEQRLKLNEYGLFKGRKMLSSKREENIYQALGLPWIAPELRENKGEIEAAKQDKLPKLIEFKNILGDLHCHSNWNGGQNSIMEMVTAAQQLGYQYLGISDHTKFLRIERGLNESQLLQQHRKIEKLNKELKGFKILHGCEANILKDGSLDIKDQVLKQLDFVIAGVHSNMKMSREQMTKRIIRAMNNPHLDIISHPTGRIIKKRDEYQLDFKKILEAAKSTKTILEINASPDRLDLKDVNIIAAKKAGVKMVINTDAHELGQLRFINYGVSQARRGWAEKQDIVNSWPLEKLLSQLKN